MLTFPLESGRVAAVQGQAGGAWDATGALLSSPVRTASTPRFAGGGIVWLEPDGFDRPGALRGARLGAPTLTDRTAPKFSVHAPPVVFRRRSGPTTVPIEVRCDEACDIDARFGGVGDYTARTLAAGRSATLRVPAYLPEQSDDFRFEIAVAAADRAGNQRRRSVGLRIKRS